MLRVVFWIGLVVTSLGCGGQQNGQRSFTGHAGEVETVAFNPKGTQLASGGTDGQIKFWDVTSGECLRTLDGHTEWVHSVAFSSDGRFLASSGRDGLLKLWDAETGKYLKSFKGHGGSTQSVINVQTGDTKKVQTSGTAAVFSVAFSPDDRLLASYASDRMIAIWDVASGKLLKSLQPDDIFGGSMVIFAPDGKGVYFAGDSLQLWDIESGKCIQSQTGGHTDTLEAIAISRNGKWIATSGKYTDHSVRVWDAKSGAILWNKDFGENQGVCSLAFAREDQVLVTGHFGGGVRLWEPQSGASLGELGSHRAAVNSLAVDSSGESLASGSSDKTVRLSKIPARKPEGR